MVNIRWCLNLKGIYYYLESYRRKPVSNTRKRNENKQQEMDSHERLPGVQMRRNDAYLFWLTTVKVRHDLIFIKCLERL